MLSEQHTKLPPVYCSLRHKWRAGLGGTLIAET